MRVLLIYRHPDMGVSIGKMFRSIEQEMRRYAQVDAVYMPAFGYGPRALVCNIRAARAAVKAQHYDIVHITGTEHYLLPFLSRQRTVVTVHDLGHLAALHGLRRFVYKCVWVYPLRWADRVCCISEFTKKEVLDAVRIPQKQLSVIRDCVGSDFIYTKKPFHVERPVVLHVGTRPHKNLDRTIEALAGMDIELRIIGRIEASTQALLDEKGMRYVVRHDLSDAELLVEYQHADIINFPSLHEGFGMPVLEGQATGRVVVTSNREPMLSVAGGAAALCDPLDVGSIRGAYERVIGDADYRNELIVKGLQNAALYSVSTITTRYFNTYQSIR